MLADISIASQSKSNNFGPHLIVALQNHDSSRPQQECFKDCLAVFSDSAHSVQALAITVKQEK